MPVEEKVTVYHRRVQGGDRRRGGSLDASLNCCKYVDQTNNGLSNGRGTLRLPRANETNPAWRLMEDALAACVAQTGLLEPLVLASASPTT